MTTPDVLQLNAETQPDGNANLDLILLQAEAAKLARLSARTVQRLDETGDFVPRVQLTGRRVGYWRRDVLAWLQARTTPSKRVA